jgi:hypothetical protein
MGPMKVSPFHSTLPGTLVHHNNDDCDAANDVRIRDRAPGSGGLPLCEKCTGLIAWRRVARRLRK